MAHSLSSTTNISVVASTGRSSTCSPTNFRKRISQEVINDIDGIEQDVDCEQFGHYEKSIAETVFPVGANSNSARWRRVNPRSHEGLRKLLMKTVIDQAF